MGLEMEVKRLLGKEVVNGFFFFFLGSVLKSLGKNFNVCSHSYLWYRDEVPGAVNAQLLSLKAENLSVIRFGLCR